MITGTFTALITPFNEKGKIDKKALKNLAIEQFKNGINGLVLCGSTGESSTLSHDEHNKIIDIVIDAIDNKIPIIAGTGSNSTAEAIAMTKDAQKAGAFCSLQVVPYYNKPTQLGLYKHFKLIADTVDLPMIIYNIPGRCGINLETATLMKLAKHPNIIGVKESSGNMIQIMDVINQRPKKFSVLSGDDNMALPVILMGGNGLISVASNIFPKKIVHMINSALVGDMKNARKQHYYLLEFFKAMFIETNPAPVKTSLALMGKIKPIFRLPLCKMQSENKKRLLKVLHSYKCL